MASTYDVGDTVRTTIIFASTAGVNADPSGTIRFGYKTPDGTVTFTAATGAGNIEKQTTGTYFYDLVTTSSGRYETRFESTGSIVTAEEAYFIVRPQKVST